MNAENSFYVYVYIDPRNFEEFYYGKGKGDRKNAHLQDTNDTEKTRRIKAITDAGLQPIIRVIAAGLMWALEELKRLLFLLLNFITKEKL
jgi:hypothetical protein